jgi:guanylate kinase
MKKKIIIIGKAASGKDYLQKRLVSNGWIPLRQYTTRPKRPNETGDEYHFVSEEEFDSIRHKLVSVQSFNGWMYGYDIDEALASDVMIFSPANYFEMQLSSSLKSRNLSLCSTLVYLDIDEDTRRERLSKRYVGGNEDDSLERRLRADVKDFEFFDGLDWNYNPDGYFRLRNENEVDDFLKKLLS